MYRLNYAEYFVLLAVPIPPYTTAYCNGGLFKELAQNILDIVTENHHFQFYGDITTYTQVRDGVALTDYDNLILDENTGENLCTVHTRNVWNEEKIHCCTYRFRQLW